MESVLDFNIRVIPDEETVEYDNQTVSQSWHAGQRFGELHKLPRSLSAQSDPHYLFNWAEARREISNIKQHLIGSDTIKTHLRQLSLNVEEFAVWANSPLCRLANLFGRRVTPALIISSNVTEDKDLTLNTMNWFLTVWLPKAEATTSVVRMMGRRATRSNPLGDIYMPLIEEFESKVLEIVNNISEQYPHLAVRMKSI